MKRFTYLFCALFIILLSANATPQLTNKAVEAAKMARQQKAMQYTVAKSHTLEAAPMVAAKKAPMAKKETVDLTAEEYTERFYTTDNDVWVKLIMADGSFFYFDVIVAEGTQELALNQTYTLSDMIANYSYGKDADGNKIEYTAATFTKSTTTYEDQTLVHFAASATDAAGNVYNIAYDQAPFIISGDTTEIVFTEPMNIPIFAEGLCQLRATTDDNDAAFTFTTVTEGSAAGTYGEDDMNLQYTFVNGMEAVSAHCVVTEDANGHIELEGWILATDGDVYHVTMFFDVPTVQSQETFTATNLAVDDSYVDWFGVIFADASNADYSISMIFSAASISAMAGTYDVSDLYSIEMSDAQGNAIEIYSGTITVAFVNGSAVITGTILATNNVQYTLNLSYVLPEADRQETIVGAGALYLESSDGMNYWVAQALNADKSRYVQILAIADNAAGTYTAADLYASYTYIGAFAGVDTTWYDIIDANIAVAVSGETATVTGTMLGQSEDGSSVVEYTLNLTLEVVDETGGSGETGSEYDATEAFKHVFPTYTLDDQYAAQYNVLVVEATDADNNIISLEFNVAEGVTTLAPGVYSVTDTYATNTVSAGSIDQYIYGSFAGSTTESGQINIPLWLIFNGTVTVHANGVIEVNAINTRGSQIQCRLGQWPEGVENVESQGQIRKVMRDGQLIIIKDGKEYTATGVSLF
ncbi:MAG: hypothetical protein IK073_04445 [Paludibacteraceae bacterium]|nr:hypothetical protein [Paludibacteraceae bacterium]